MKKKRGRKPVKGRTRRGSRVLTVRISKSTYTQFKRFCKAKKLDKHAIMEKMIEDFIKKHENETVEEKQSDRSQQYNSAF